MSKHNIIISVDCRESELKRLIESVYPQGSPKQNIRFNEKLGVGDVIFYIDDIPSLIIERKEVSDFLNSLVDGRFEEQCARIAKALAENPKLFACVALEGNLDAEIRRRGNSGFPKAYITKVLNLLYPTYRIALQKTSNLMDTLMFIAQCETLYQAKGHPADIVGAEDFILNSLHVGKKRDLSEKDRYILSLCQIGGITKSIAKAIHELYPSYTALVLAYESTEDKANMFLQFDYGGTRKIGKKTSVKIYRFIYGINE